MGQDGVIDAAERLEPAASGDSCVTDRQVTREELDRAFAFYREQDARRNAERRQRLRLV
jgi:hypothetical protein